MSKVWVAGLAATAAALALAGCAAQPTTSPAAKPAHVQKVAQRHCLKDTGSRIPAPAGGCMPATGRVYDAEELGLSGRMQTGDILNELIP
jgi:hypothetical protein